MAPDPAETAVLRALVIQHGGSLTAIARSLGCSRQYASRKLAAAGLSDEAAHTRARSGVSGPRRRDVVDAPQRAEMLKALVATGSDDRAMAVLGMTRRTFYRLKAALKIDDDAIAEAQIAAMGNSAT